MKHPEKQQIKQQQFHRLWHDDNQIKKMVQDTNEFDYSEIDSLVNFTGTHPLLMKKRIESINWDIAIDPHRKKFTPKTWFLYWFEKLFGIRIGAYKNYKLI